MLSLLLKTHSSNPIFKNPSLISFSIGLLKFLVFPCTVSKLLEHTYICVCVCVCVCIHVYLYLYVFTCAYVLMYTSMLQGFWIYVSISICVFVHMNACIHACTSMQEVIRCALSPALNRLNKPPMVLQPGWSLYKLRAEN
jgi:hypothetical protein